MSDKITLFIERSKNIFGERYDYSEVMYINSKLKVKISCKKHGPFYQTPESHLHGSGCAKCYGNIKKTTEQFIIDAKKKHGNTYDYSMVNYTNATTSVEIICKKHGLFYQTPQTHLKGSNGCGCGKCYRRVKKTTEQFIIDAKKKHGNTYDYSMVNYTGNKNQIKIICKKHGLFYQTPQTHLKGCGCNKCGMIYSADIRRSNNDEFIIKATKKHGNTYDYSMVNYAGCSIPVNIICKKHGVFKQRPECHYIYSGCQKCQNKKRYSKPSIDWLNFISKLYNIEIQHGENIGEYRIPDTRFFADGFCEENNTIYEFHGDYWHGNPKKFIHTEINQITKCTFGELYQRTLDKEQLIRDMGYNLITIWDNDWKKLNRYVKILQRKYRNSKL